MEKLTFIITIKAPVTLVYNTMLGIDNKKTYEDWTSVFNPTSTYEGNWEVASKILFVGTDEHGKKGGMVSKIEQNLKNEFVSILHYGILKDGVEITSGEEVEKWAGGNENYTFKEVNNTTELTVDVDVLAEFKDCFNDSYPKALEHLKTICEL